MRDDLGDLARLDTIIERERQLFLQDGGLIACELRP